jgi:hypothetical protein
LAKTYKGWTDNIWLLSFWKFLNKVGLLITISQLWLPMLTRWSNVALMDFFIEQGFSANVLGTLNHCRLYLQVLTLSNIVSADGLCIVPDVFIGIPLSDRKSTLRWPCQQRPCSKSWAIWKTALQILQPRNKLLAPLGAWLSAESHQTWFWFKDSILPKLYRRDPSSTKCDVFQGFMNPRRTTRASPVLFF